MAGFDANQSAIAKPSVSSHEPESVSVPGRFSSPRSGMDLLDHEPVFNFTGTAGSPAKSIISTGVSVGKNEA